MPRQQSIHAAHVPEDLMHRLTLDAPRAYETILETYVAPSEGA